MTRKYISRSAEETVSIAQNIAAELKPGAVLLMYGDLGAGKTTFITGLAKGLGCTDPVSSPTYTIMNIYGGKTTLCHFDLYRIDDPDQLFGAGFFDAQNGRNIVAVEWCERAGEYLPDDAISVRFTNTGENEREIEITYPEEL